MVDCLFANLFEQLKTAVVSLQSELADLRAENARLKAELAGRDLPPTQEQFIDDFDPDKTQPWTFQKPAKRQRVSTESVESTIRVSPCRRRAASELTSPAGSRCGRGAVVHVSDKMEVRVLGEDMERDTQRRRGARRWKEGRLRCEARRLWVTGETTSLDG